MQRFSYKVLNTLGRIAKEAIKTRIIDVRIAGESNYKKPLIGHPRADYVANRRAENQSRSESRYRYD